MFKRTKNKELALLVDFKTDVGRTRKNNEDAFIVERVNSKRAESKGCLCLVADGMGGQDHGDVASKVVVSTFNKAIEDIDKYQNVEDWLKAAGRRANDAIRYQLSRLNPANGMGSTVVGGLFLADECYFFNVGDSRAYMLREGNMRRITKDHSLMEIFIDGGVIQPEDVYTHPRRGELSRYVGQPDDLEVDVFPVGPLQKDDVILICSDGLWEMVRDPEMKMVLENNKNPVKATTELIDKANQNGGADNITAIVVRVIEK
ncbi:MAG: PP2C family protein-serine/threonine phosphatase [Methanobacterium sp.]